MTANYKRKRLMEENCLDKRPTGIRKSLNSSERLRAKNEVAKTLNDRHSIIDELRWDLENRQSIECHQNEMHGPHTYMQTMLALLEVGDFDLYKCTCVDAYKLTDEQILREFGL